MVQEATERVEADYMRGGLSSESYDRLGTRLAGERAAAEAEVARHRAWVEEIEEQAAAFDAEGEFAEAYDELYRAIAGQVSGARVHTALLDPTPDSFLFAFRAVEGIRQTIMPGTGKPPEWAAMHAKLGTTEAYVMPLTDVAKLVRHGKEGDPAVRRVTRTAKRSKELLDVARDVVVPLTPEQRERILAIFRAFLAKRVENLERLTLDKMTFNVVALRVTATILELGDARSLLRYRLAQRLERSLVTALGTALQAISRVIGGQAIGVHANRGCSRRWARSVTVMTTR
jgi:hypothetical protein